MPKLGLQQIARLVNGQVINGRKGLTFSDYHFDSRKMEKNSLFFALKTDTNDGHRYVKDLMAYESVAAVVSKDFSKEGIHIPLIVVEDPFTAVLALAEAVRNLYPSIKYVGITGSAGKTTTKEFLYQILSSKMKVYRSHLNWNNWIGLPFSILKMDGDEAVAVFELGMSDPGIGEIDLLASILKPDIAMILNILPVHLEFLKTIENIAQAKSEILNYLGSDSIAFVQGDFDSAVRLAKKKIGRIEYFGKTKGINRFLLGNITRKNDISEFNLEYFGIRICFKTKLISHSQIENLFAAMLAAKHLGMKDQEIQRAIWNLKPLARRGSISKVRNRTIIDESYNSNPEALKKTLSWIDIEYRENKIAVLGDMLELGSNERRFHRETGHFFAKLKYDRLITVGDLAKEIALGAAEGGVPEKSIQHYETIEALETDISDLLTEGSVVLFKSSRNSGLNVIVENYCEEK